MTRRALLWAAVAVIVALVGLGTRDVVATVQIAIGAVAGLVLVEIATFATASFAPLTGRRERRAAPSPRRLRQFSPPTTFAAHARRSQWDLHTRMRRALRRTARTLLLRRRGLQLDDPRDAERIRQIVGPPAWDVIRPDRPEPERPTARGLSDRQLDQILAGLERI